ncbi:MAG: orotidine-5'-phosphate decarboxylase [Saprospiraceae bacterium]|jgi:orotidine-5'-phosphate decarboxylase|nr:orotidine-5'-phosphate decarboxylase [Saprospiraceae bacterium]
MTRKELTDKIRERKNFLCIGLDTDIQKIPGHFQQFDDPVFEFNKAIIDATSDICVAYKPNLAFYEALGPAGWKSLEKTMEYIPKGIFTIADAKRGDIGNTSKLYAKTFFSYFQFDAVTVAPYMGEDSVTPFLEFEDKWVILLCLTSNPGSNDFQQIRSASGTPLFVSVLEKATQWGTPENLMFVVGATHPEGLGEVRSIVPDHFLLVPGLGAQGGDLDAVFSHGANRDVGLLVNSSRDILYAGSGADFADKAREKALQIQRNMSLLLGD